VAPGREENGVRGESESGANPWSYYEKSAIQCPARDFTILTVLEYYTLVRFIVSLLFTMLDFERRSSTNATLSIDYACCLEFKM